ncbi:MAG TPA: hypothetical protein VHE57_02110 [Mycobacteriales bacterium]|nr:hypothetical protein [Mycobacteriales bacterium]
MLHASITRYGIVRGTNRELVEAAAILLAETPSLDDLLADMPRQEQFAAA